MNVWQRLKQSKIWGLSLKISFTLVAFYFALRDVDFVHLPEILHAQDGGSIAVACLLILAQICLGGMRWHLVLNRLKTAGSQTISKLEALKLYYISVFFNCCLPGTVGGDVVRVWLIKSDHTPLQTAINSVIIDRVIALLALFLLVLAGLPLIGREVGMDMRYIVGAIMLLVAGVWLSYYIQRLLLPYQRLRIVRWSMHLIECVHLLVRYPLTTVISLTVGIVSHVCFSMAGYVLAQSMGMELSMLHSIALIPLVLLISTLPISIGGWGVREASMVTMLGIVGVPQAQALMLSIEYGLLNIFTSLPAVLFWLVYRRQHSPVSRLSQPE